MPKTMKILLLVLAVAAAVSVSAMIASERTAREYEAYYGDYIESLQKAHENDSETVRKIREIEEYLDYYFIDDYDEKTLADAAAAAVTEATGDRWSYYLSAEEYGSYEEMMNNAYVGIGVTITEQTELGGMRIESVTPDSPALAAGIQVGDILTHVEGVPSLELGMDETKNRVRGEAGTSVQLTFRRGEQDTYTVDVLRANIETAVASCELLEGGIGYITIKNFDRRCAEETISCIEKIRKDGAKALLFDLRFNGGGLKDEMVEILDYLLPAGVLFRSEDYQGRTAKDMSLPSCLKMPMAVLVNEDSYSAAEFFAAALQEYEWATVVGARTCGKGNFQSGFRLSDGSLLNISIGKYYTPNGRHLTDVGVTPDVETALSEEDYTKLYYGQLEKQDDAQLQAAVSELLQKIS